MYFVEFKMPRLNCAILLPLLTDSCSSGFAFSSFSSIM